MEQIVLLENSRIKVEIGNKGEFTVSDPVDGFEWGKPQYQEYSGLIKIEYQGRILDFALGTNPGKVDVQKKPHSAEESAVIQFKDARCDNGSIDIQLLVNLTVHENLPKVDVRIESLILPPGYKFIELLYPSCLVHLLSAKEDGYLVVPKGYGCIVPSTLKGGFMRYMHNLWANIVDITQILPFGGGAPNCISMPWYGAYKCENGKSSGIFINVHTFEDASLKVVCNSVKGEIKKTGPHGEPREVGRGARISALTPVWRSSHGEFSFARKCTIELILEGTYVDMAKRYREYAREVGRYKSLEEKISENPNVEKLIGAPNVKIFIAYNRINKPEFRSWDDPVLDGYNNVLTSFESAKEVVSELWNMGVDRALISIEGWQRNGFCNMHPDIWPPHESAGGLQGLREVCDEAVKLGYVIALDDNYQDFFLNSPLITEVERVVTRNSDGSPVEGGMWAGGPVVITCSSKAIEFADYNLDLIQRELEPNAHYLDTIAANPPIECYSLDHPMTREQDVANRKHLLKSLRDRGLVVGAEFGNDWAVLESDYFEGLPGESVGFYNPVIAYDFGVRIPLFPLVYHDAVVCHWQHGMPYGREDHVDHFLADLIQGNPSYWVITTEHWPTMKPLFITTYEIISSLHRETATVELVEHKVLSDDYSVQMTSYANGTSIIVNFGIINYKIVDGDILPAKGFIIRGNDQEIKGSFSRNCLVESKDL